MKLPLTLLLFALIWVSPLYSQTGDASLSTVWTESTTGEGRPGWQATGALGYRWFAVEGVYSSASVTQETFTVGPTSAVTASSSLNWQSAMGGPRITLGQGDTRVYGRWLIGSHRDAIDGAGDWRLGWLGGGGVRYALDRHVGVRVGVDYLSRDAVQVGIGFEAGW